MVDRIKNVFSNYKNNNIFLYVGIGLVVIILLFIASKITFSKDEAKVNEVLEYKVTNPDAEVSLLNFKKYLLDDIDIEVKKGKVEYSITFESLNEEVSITQFEAAGLLRIPVSYKSDDMNRVKSIEIELTDFSEVKPGIYGVSGTYSEKGVEFVEVMKKQELFLSSINFEYLNADVE